MPPFNAWKEILDALKDLNDDQFSDFIFELKDPNEDPRIRACEVEDKTRVQVRELLMSRHNTESEAVVRTIRALRVIGCNNGAKELESRKEAHSNNLSSLTEPGPAPKPHNHETNNVPKTAQKVEPKAKKLQTSGKTKLLFGQYKGETFEWLLQNDVGYAAYVVGSHQIQKETGETQFTHLKLKDDLAEYVSHFPDAEEKVRLYKEGQALVGFGKYKKSTRKELYESTDEMKKKYVKRLKSKKTYKNPEMEATIKYIHERSPTKTEQSETRLILQPGDSDHQPSPTSGDGSLGTALLSPTAPDGSLQQHREMGPMHFSTWTIKSAMKAKNIIRGNKTLLLEILSGDHRLILNKVQEHSLISDREYNNLKGNNENVEGHLSELLDKLMRKGEKTCHEFIKLLKNDAMIHETFPNLKTIQWTVDNKKQTQIQWACPGQQEAKFQKSAGQVIRTSSSNTEPLKTAPLKRKPSASNEPGPSSEPHSAAKKPKKVTPKAKENGHNTQTVPKKKKKKPPSKTNNVPKNSQKIKKVAPKAKAKVKVKKTQTALGKNKKTNNVPRKVASKAKGKKTQTALRKNEKNKPSSNGLGPANKKPSSKKVKKVAPKAK